MAVIVGVRFQVGLRLEVSVGVGLGLCARGRVYSCFRGRDAPRFLKSKFMLFICCIAIAYI